MTPWNYKVLQLKQETALIAVITIILGFIRLPRIQESQSGGSWLAVTNHESWSWKAMGDHGRWRDGEMARWWMGAEMGDGRWWKWKMESINLQYSSTGIIHPPPYCPTISSLVWRRFPIFQCSIGLLLRLWRSATLDGNMWKGRIQNATAMLDHCLRYLWRERCHSIFAALLRCRPSCYCFTMPGLSSLQHLSRFRFFLLVFPWSFLDFCVHFLPWKTKTGSISLYWFYIDFHLELEVGNGATLFPGRILCIERCFGLRTVVLLFDSLVLGRRS